MSHIVFCWELGAASGHIDGFLPVARELASRGHELSFVVRDLSRAESALGDDGFRYLQAPVFAPEDPPPAVSYAEILLHNGFNNSGALLGRCRAWLELFRGLRPDLVIADHSPSALVAARAADLTCTLFGPGFFSPPRVSPFPSLRPWMEVPAARLAAADAKVLSEINVALDCLGEKQLSAVHELFEVSEDFLCTFAELDHYPDRRNAHYWGPRFHIHGVEPRWPQEGGARVFAYLNSRYPHLQHLLATLATSPHRTLVHLSGAITDQMRSCESERFAFSPGPCNLTQIANEADLYVGHGGFGTSSAMLFGGCPQVLLTFQLEQFLNGRNIAALGAGVCAIADSERPDHKGLIDGVLSGTGFRRSAQAFADRYADFDIDAKTVAIADRCEEILGFG